MPDNKFARRRVTGNAGLIAISTHGRTGFEHVLLGSTAEYVVRHASCPVLVVPSRERALPRRTCLNPVRPWVEMGWRPRCRLSRFRANCLSGVTDLY